MKISLKTIEPEAMESGSVLNFINELSEAYEPVLFSIRNEYWKRLNLPQLNFNSWWTDTVSETLDEEGIFGDIIMTESKNILYYKVDVIEKTIEAGFIGKTAEDETFDSFTNNVLGCAKRNFSCKQEDWSEEKYDEAILKAIEERSSTIIPSKEEDELSIILEDLKTRDFLFKIKDCSSTSIAKIFPPEELPSIAPIVDMFEKRNIITKDFVVLCSKTGQPILKVSSRSALEETPQGANKCFICGNPLSQEKIDEIVTCSKNGKHFIEHGYWLQIRVMHALSKAGISPEQIKVWQSDNDLRYLFAIINGQSFLFVLADNQITVDDIYRMNLYISSYNVKNVLIISTENIPLIIKKYTQNGNHGDVSFDFIETIEAIDEAIELFIIERCSAYIEQILSSFINFTPVKLNGLVIDSITNKDTKKVKQEVTPAEKPTVIPAPEKKNVTKDPAADLEKELEDDESLEEMI